MDLHGVSSDADVQSCGGDIRDSADGDDQRRYEWRNDLLHDERDDADDLVDAIHRSDYGKRDGDDRGDRGGEWVRDQYRQDSGLYDHERGSSGHKSRLGIYGGRDDAEWQCDAEWDTVAVNQWRDG